MPWWLAGLVANAAIQVVEYLNRNGTYSHWGAALLRTGPFIVLAQYGLYVSWNRAPSMMLAWACFTIGNTLMRLLSSYFFIGERFGWKTVAGVAIMMAGAWLIKGK